MSQDVREPEVLYFRQNGWVPNNERLPALFYRAVLETNASDPAALFEQIFGRNGWPPDWRNGIYPFHHYHSTAHEVLGIANGHARVILGGENGRQLGVRAGDVLVLPAGTGHCKLEASSDFLVVGAYPPNQKWNVCRTALSAEALRKMEQLPFPKKDPVHGSAGPCLCSGNPLSGNSAAQL